MSPAFYDSSLVYCIGAPKSQQNGYSACHHDQCGHVHCRARATHPHLQKSAFFVFFGLFRHFRTGAETMCFRCRFTGGLKEHKPFGKITIFPGNSDKVAENPAKSSWTLRQARPNTLFRQSFTLGKGRQPFSPFLTEKSLFSRPTLHNKPGNF